MKTVFVLFDSLNRLALGTYGGTAVATPNFDRFARKSVTFDKHYVGSLPCMPARRDMHTGRLNFTHRNWGPLEPFDESFARILSKNSNYTHLISDHLHYFENGGWGYANAFDSWDFVRGQEYDALKVMVRPPVERYRERFDERHYPLHTLPEKGPITRGNTEKAAFKRLRGAISQEVLSEEDDFPTARCFAKAFEFLDTNRGEDAWFLQLECFDPHEPFVVPERFQAAYDTGRNGKILNWPMYERNTNSPEEIAGRVGTMDCSIAPLTEPDMRTTHPALWIGPSKCQLKLGRYLRGVKFHPSGFQRYQSSCEPGNRIGPRHARTVGLVPNTPAAIRGTGGSPAARPHCQKMPEKEAGSLLLTHDDSSQPTADMSVEYTQSLDTLFRAEPEVRHPPVEVAAETRHTR